METRRNNCYCGYPDDWNDYDNDFDENYRDGNCGCYENNYSPKNNNRRDGEWRCKCTCYKKREEKRCNHQRDDGMERNNFCYLCGLFKVFRR